MSKNIFKQLSAWRFLCWKPF